MPHRRQVLRLRRTASRLRDLTARRSRAEWLPSCECRVGRPEAAKRVEEVLDGKTAIREGRYVTEMMENHRGVWGSGSGTPAQLSVSQVGLTGRCDAKLMAAHTQNQQPRHQAGEAASD